jgi:hypothetical protein
VVSMRCIPATPAAAPEIDDLLAASIVLYRCHLNGILSHIYAFKDTPVSILKG